MTTPEGRIQQGIQRRLAELGVFCFKVHGSALMPAGLPDLICCVDGQFLGIEVKTPQTKGDVSARQIYMHGKIKEADGQVAVCCSMAEAEEVVERMRDAMRAKNRR